MYLYSRISAYQHVGDHGLDAQHRESDAGQSGLLRNNAAKALKGRYSSSNTLSKHDLSFIVTRILMK